MARLRSTPGRRAASLCVDPLGWSTITSAPTFSMIKAKFRDHVRSKTPEAMVNEVLCKILCHNVCVLIQEAHELGISASFAEQGK